MFISVDSFCSGHAFCITCESNINLEILILVGIIMSAHFVRT